jgi:integrase
MASLEKRTWTKKSGEVSTAWRVTYTDQSDRIRTRQFKKRAAAKAFQDTVTTAVQSGTHVHDRDSLTIAEAGKVWLDACKLGRDGRKPVEPHTLRVYRGHVNNHIVPRIGSLLVSKTRKRQIKSFRDDLLRDGVSRELTLKVISSLHGIFEEAIDNEQAVVNATKKVRVVTEDRSTSEEDRRVTIPARETLKELLTLAKLWCSEPPAIVIRSRVTKNPRFTKERARSIYLLLRTKVATGMRISELLGLPRKHLDLKAATIDIRQRADEGRLGPPKSVSGYRTIDLPSDLVADLREWLLLRPKGQHDLVFPNASGGIERYQNLHRRFWQPLLLSLGKARHVKNEEGKLELETDFTLHDLRHFHASHYISLGANPLEVKDRMGHSSIKVTYDIYGHLFQDELARAGRRAHAETMSAQMFGDG